MSVNAVPATSPRRGRPRSGEIDRAILRAVQELLREEGYRAMSIDGVAARAGVGKPAIYRRHASKAELVIATLVELTPRAEPHLPRDSRAALRALVGGAARALATPGSMTVIGSLLAEEGREPNLVRTARDRLFAPQQARVRAVLEQAIVDGIMRADLAIQPTIDMLFGAILARAALGEPADGRWVDDVVDAAWLGLAQHHRTIKEAPDA